jgi:hypothetical protein
MSASLSLGAAARASCARRIAIRLSSTTLLRA